MEQHIQEMKKNLKDVLSRPGNPNGEWVDAGEACRKFNMESLAYEVQLQLPDFSISLSHGKRHILIDDYSNNTHGVISADNGSYRISDGGSLFAYITNDGYFLADDIVEEVVAYAEGITNNHVVVKVNDTNLSLCINNIKIENIIDAWKQYVSAYSTIAALKQQ